MKSHNPIRRNQRRQTIPNAKSSVEDERGWAGQHGQSPANEEEKNYRPARKKPSSDKTP
jgi:hypothetical protein